MKLILVGILLFFSLMLSAQKKVENLHSVNLSKINLNRVLRLKRPLRFNGDNKHQLQLDDFTRRLFIVFRHDMPRMYKGEVICPTTKDYFGTEWKTFMMSKPHRKVLMSRGIKYIVISIFELDDRAYCAMRVW